MSFALSGLFIFTTPLPGPPLVGLASTQAITLRAFSAFDSRPRPDSNDRQCTIDGTRYSLSRITNGQRPWHCSSVIFMRLVPPTLLRIANSRSELYQPASRRHHRRQSNHRVYPRLSFQSIARKGLDVIGTDLRRAMTWCRKRCSNVLSESFSANHSSHVQAYSARLQLSQV